MIAERVLQSDELTHALAGSSTLVVAVSGGCDSVALLHILLALRERLDLSLHVASLDHGIRGAAGQRDVDFVSGLAERWQLPCTTALVDVPALAGEWGKGLEAAARRARYDFLARVAQRVGCNCVAVGHHANDQSETVLMHIIRGSGARGLGGMRAVSPMPFHPSITLLRPLLSQSRDQLEAYCAAHDLSYLHDKTNEDRSYTRNYLRHEVLVRLTRLNPDLLGAFGRLAESAAVDEDFFDDMLDSLLLSIVEKTDSAWRMDRQDFRALHPALQRRLLRRAYHELAGESASLSYRLTLDVVAWTQHARVGKMRELGDLVELYIDYDDMWIRRKGSHLSAEGHRLIPRETDEQITTSTPFARHGLRVSIAEATTLPDSGASLRLKTGCEVRLRTRRPGDRFRPRGMGGHSRKLKDWMIDRKVSRYLRDRVPLVTVDGAVFAISLGQTWHLSEPDLSFSPDECSQVLVLA